MKPVLKASQGNETNKMREPDLHEIMTAPPTSAEAHAARRYQRGKSRRRIEELREERWISKERPDW